MNIYGLSFLGIRHFNASYWKQAVLAHPKRSKKIKKTIDTTSPFCEIDLTHGIKNRKHRQKMRTQTLLIAAAALAAAVTSANAQTVYSANIVGYVNTVLPGNSAYTMITSPLNNGTNTVEGQMGSALNSGDTVYIWENTGYYSSTYFGGANGFLSAPDDWIDVYGNTTNSPALVPGQGFFYSTQSGGQETNTWTGNVILTNTVALPGNSAYSMIGSAVAVAGYADSTNFNLPLDSGDTLYVWEANGYYSSTFFGGVNGFLSAPDDWIDVYGNTTNAPYINVGQGFFYSTQSGTAETWNQNDSYINP
jgi:hypothetical protein